MRVQADTDVCIGAGQCVLTEPAVFDQSEQDATVVLLATEVPTDSAEAVREAVAVCPSQALSVVED